MKTKPFWQSYNFWTGIITAIVAVFFSYGIEVPEDTVQNVKDAVFQKNLAAIIIALGNLINILYHIFRVKKEEPAQRPAKLPDNPKLPKKLNSEF